ncbi:hypothetical protein GGS23DRAFT_619027 [Durotheca rogersii]|uniref:uncharacterized protein n=1 Tax=Durotheca rogersii TaxID=419775 RepID=UPI00222069B5|nr:uncharacterized protein GGS23DRAFT_619027 [Durotheca rogersii]KAI5855053.1 hypothetical protein GGS23DRAFT_619027 [Durotheca rogersii]
MTSHDVHDVLNLPLNNTGPRPAKKPKNTVQRPSLKGLAREVQSLGGDNPIAIVPEISNFKRRRFGSRKPAARWEWRTFYNSARYDQSLSLRHWRRQTEEQSTARERQDTATGTIVNNKQKQLDDSGFAKFNVQVDIPQYSDDQYYSNLTSREWTKDETDYLFDLARDFDLRWPLIWDRYEYEPKLPDNLANGDRSSGTEPNTAMVSASKVRTMEDLKARYYEVAAKMMAVQKPVQYMTQAEFALHEVMANFNPISEAHRKKFAADALTRSRDEAHEEELLLVEVRRIVARQEKFNQERRELYNRLEYPHTEQDINAFKSSAGLQTLLQNLMNVDKSKKRKSLLEANGSNTPTSAHPSNNLSGHGNPTPTTETRRESIAASSTGHRDSMGGTDRPERPAKKGAQPERRKLGEQEERLYGVSHHDRLPSGPTFRYERINKILTTKSHAQHQRITNTLAELDIPSRLNMPTRAVVEEMERLLNSIGILLDMRKMNDKIDAEIRLEKAKKVEREKALAPAQLEAAVKTSDVEAVNDGQAKVRSVVNEDVSSADRDSLYTAPAVAVKPNGDAASFTNNMTDYQAEGKSTLAADSVETATGPVRQGPAEDHRGGQLGGGGHKRSASELSSASDRGMKRQKK